MNGTFPSQRLSRDKCYLKVAFMGDRADPFPPRLLPRLRAWDVNGRLINLILISSFKEATVSVLGVCGERAT